MAIIDKFIPWFKWRMRAWLISYCHFSAKLKSWRERKQKSARPSFLPIQIFEHLTSFSGTSGTQKCGFKLHCVCFQKIIVSLEPNFFRFDYLPNPEGPEKSREKFLFLCVCVKKSFSLDVKYQYYLIFFKIESKWDLF